VEFDFLPNLPKSNLDDRAYKDLVEECILRIPRYCPDWTNFNPSDPGITLVELFAWLTDQMLLRFNQVPRRNYVAFLELLGIRLQPPSPAQVDVTFYLTQALAEPYHIPAGTEITTVHSIGEDEIVFTTNYPLVIGTPRIQHFFRSEIAEQKPRNLVSALNDTWSYENGGWSCREQTPLFGDQPQPGNCFYLLFDEGDLIEGNVLSLTFKGEAGTTTGINPSTPPRVWEAWNGQYWESVLIREIDDGTRGFSFSEATRLGFSAANGADTVLHCPQVWPSERFLAYEGRWLRCRYITPSDWQPGYRYTPRITGIAARSLGGSVVASHSFTVLDELLGTSTGKPGQNFLLRERPVLERHPEEYIQIELPGDPPQRWREVPDFSESGSEDLHYVIDSLSGVVQFGPLIRESSQLQLQTQWRSKNQYTDSLEMTRLEDPLQTLNGGTSLRNINPGELLERQYGKVPPRGAEITIVAYRSGGGARGNVQAGKLCLLRASLPYVERVINHRPAQGGTDAESLSEAVIRVPHILRTRDRAITPEDFEVLAIQAGQGKIARAYCLPVSTPQDAGKVRLLLIPQVSPSVMILEQGLNPEESMQLEFELKQQIENFLADRKTLGVQVILQEAYYVRVSVQVEIAIDPQYNTPRGVAEIQMQLRILLYRFLNPLTGGQEGKGWPLGAPLYTSDVIAVCQKVTGVRHLGVVRIFELQKQGNQWARLPPSDAGISPGKHGLIASWEDNVQGLGHTISMI
jgi:predicted phage baseplate assembly protein